MLHRHPAPRNWPLRYVLLALGGLLLAFAAWQVVLADLHSTSGLPQPDYSRLTVAAVPAWPRRQIPQCLAAPHPAAPLIPARH